MHAVYVADMKSRRQDFISGVRVKDIRPMKINKYYDYAVLHRFHNLYIVCQLLGL